MRIPRYHRAVSCALAAFFLTAIPSVAVADTATSSAQPTTQQATDATELTAEVHEFENPLDGDAYKSQSDDISLLSISDSQLSQLADRIERSADNLDDQLLLEGNGIYEADAHAAIDMVWVKAPQAFYIKSIMVWRYPSGLVSKLTFEYQYDKATVRSMIAKMDAKVSEALTWCDSRTMSQADKAKALHDYIVRNVSYDTNHQWANRNGAYGALVDGHAVCGGYAEGYAVLLERTGITQTCVISEAMNHEWNVVTIDGVTYNADTCWDDPISKTGSDGGFDRTVQSKYFLFSDAYGAANGYHSDRPYAPACNDRRYEGVRWDQYRGPIKPLYRFKDVDANGWYVTSGMLESVVERGIMNGYSTYEFGPNDTMTRGQFACMMKNALRKTDVGSVGRDASFSDVASGAYYADAVEWCAEHGLMNGFSDTQFGPDSPVTREQVVTVIHNLLGRPSCGKYDKRANEASEWARDAVAWGIESGIIGQGSSLDAKRTCTRIEAATMIMRAIDSGYIVDVL